MTLHFYFQFQNGQVRMSMEFKILNLPKQQGRDVNGLLVINQIVKVRLQKELHKEKGAKAPLIQSLMLISQFIRAL